MLKPGKYELLQTLSSPIIEALGFELWGIEFLSQGRRSVVRVYIDKEDGGVSVDDCAVVSRQLGSVFDVEDPIKQEYSLEVSSPGMDRPLYTIAQYKRFIGQQVSIHLRQAYEKRRKYTGILQGVENDEIVLVADEHEYLFPIDTIDKANIIPQF